MDLLDSDKYNLHPASGSRFLWSDLIEVEAVDKITKGKKFERVILIQLPKIYSGSFALREVVSP